MLACLLLACLLPVPDSRFPIPDSRFPIPDSLLPIPCSLLCREVYYITK
ncbi:MAG: hypothetical protein F6K26_13370 [Moorea sp. SIO2I5]|nr:hypothetical protein [Moorena sp. SIO2I5]